MNILFVLAHPDDEAFGPGGTIAKLAETDNVHLLTLCRGNRVGSEKLAKERLNAYKKVCGIFNCSYTIREFDDLDVNFVEAANIITEMVNDFQPSIVYTHSTTDLHQIHKLVGEATKVACRPTPNSPVDHLYACEIPSATDWSFECFTPNVYEDISDYIDMKLKALELYKTELREYPDARSIESVGITALNRGRQVGFNAAEAFQLVFSRYHKTQ